MAEPLVRPRDARDVRSAPGLSTLACLQMQDLSACSPPPVACEAGSPAHASDAPSPACIPSTASAAALDGAGWGCAVPSAALSRRGPFCVRAQMWAWNKVALMRKVLAEMPPERAPWILYMQPDTIIDDIAFTFPFEMYQGKEWVSVGTAESVLQGWASGACGSLPSPLRA